MTRTTPPRPADIAVVFPQLAPLARTAYRLHPRPGTPTLLDSSAGGPLLWPASEAWPLCEGPHAAPAVHPPSSLADVRLLRRIRAATWGQPGYETDVAPEERAVLGRIGAGRPVPAGPVAMLPVAQLYTREVPGLRPPGDADLLQVLWCPFDHPEQAAPRTALYWRAAASIADVLMVPPEPEVVQYDGYVPEPCLVEPEQVTEYPAPAELGRDLAADIEHWSAEQKVGIDPGGSYDGAEEAFYAYELSVAPGWKVGGWAPWSFTDPSPQLCPECGVPMEPMLTIASEEWGPDDLSWIPHEDQVAASRSKYSYLSPSRPTMITIGDNYNLQIYACPVSPEHPHKQLTQ